MINNSYNQKINDFETQLLLKITMISELAKKLHIDDTEAIAIINDQRYGFIKALTITTLKDFVITPEIVQFFDRITKLTSKPIYLDFYFDKHTPNIEVSFILIERKWKLSINDTLPIILENYTTGNYGIESLKEDLNGVMNILTMLDNGDFTNPILKYGVSTNDHSDLEPVVTEDN